MAYAFATAAVVALIVIVIGRPRGSLHPDDAAIAVQPTDAQQRVSDPVSTSPPRVIVPPSRVSAVASTAASTKKNTSVAARVAAAPSTPVASTAPVAEASGREEPAAKHADAEPATTASAVASSTVETAGVAPVTVTGCLEVSVTEDRFRLTDTEGGDVPKARSWRTGFLKKRSATVDLVAPTHGLSLDKQVGKRVAATGVLTNRTLTVGSLRVVSPNCN